MRRFRVGFVLLAFLMGLAGLHSAAFGLSAEDQAFLKKKIIARWNITGKKQIEAAYARGVDILEDHPNPASGYFTVLVSPEELDALRADGYSLDIIDPDVHASYTAKAGKTMNGFLTWAEAIGKLDSFHTAYPTLTSEMLSLGSSLEGIDIWAMKISDNPGVDEDEPEVLFTGIHHAREPISMEVVLHTMRTLLFNYGSDPAITNLVNEREIYFVPFVNPDGYMWNEVLISFGQAPLWRKNRRANAGGSYGVDPNRNYGNHWGYDNNGSSPNGSSETYRGTAAFSEPETQCIRDFVNSRNFVIAVNFHSYSNLFLWAPGYLDFYTPDEFLFRAIGDTVTSFNSYTPQPGWALYNTNGDADDWFYFDKGVLSFTPEVGSGSDGFWPDPSRIPALVNENVPGNLVLIELADNPGRILPPAMPTWIGPSLVGAPDFDLQWSDPGGLNGAVSFELKELLNFALTADAANNTDNWTPNAFSVSPSRSHSAPSSFWSGASDNRRSSLVGEHYYTPVANDTLRMRVWYDIELDYDYAYVEVSSDYGQSWATLPGNITTNNDPFGNNRGNGITGSSGGSAFIEARFSLNSYVGQPILFRLSYETDGAVIDEGIYFDDIYPVVTFGSEVVLDPEVPNPTYPITGKDPGVYYYTLRSTDVHGQVGPTTPPHAVTVDYVTCDCNCHTDPVCDGVPDVLDLVETVNAAFRNAPPTIDPNCPHPGGRADVDCSGATTVLDVVKVVGVAFRNDNPATTYCDPCAP